MGALLSRSSQGSGKAGACQGFLEIIRWQWGFTFEILSRKSMPTVNERHVDGRTLAPRALFLGSKAKGCGISCSNETLATRTTGQSQTPGRI